MAKYLEEMSVKRAILWFRQDLRIEDNEALHEALRLADEILPIYVFDERIFLGKTSFGFKKTGKYRAKFIINSVKSLRHELEEVGSGLMLKIGQPEDIIFNLAREIKADWVFCNRERTDEELRVQDAMEKKLWAIGCEMRYTRGKMLYYTSDLPFPITHSPDSWTVFKKEVERVIKVREPLSIPDQIPYVDMSLDLGTLPSMEDFGFADDRSEYEQGGSVVGKALMRQYFHEEKRLKNYETDREFSGLFNTSHLSAYLSQGVLSPKMIYFELAKYEQEHGVSSSTTEFKHSLMYRDYFRLIGKKHGNAIFQIQGLGQGEAKCQSFDTALVSRWIEGRTGVSIIDAIMNELATTGFTHHRGRYVTASYFVQEMKQNWLIGAEYFESILVDYDPCSNYVNWMEIAGVGPEQREFKPINLEYQEQKYFDSAYLVKWNTSD